MSSGDPEKPDDRQMEKVTKQLKKTNLTATAPWTTKPVADWSKGQKKRYRQKKKHFELADKDLPLEMMRVEEEVRKCSKSKASDSSVGQGGAGTSSSASKSARGNAKKRRLSSDETAPSGAQAKKNRGEEDSSSSSSSTSSELMAYLVQGDPATPMTGPQIEKVKQRLTEKILSVGRQPRSATDPPPKLPRFIRTVEVGGALRCEAADTFSVEWLSQFANGLSPPWHGCKLQVTDESSLPKTYHVEVILDPPLGSQDMIRHDLHMANPELGCLNWRLTGRTVNKGTKTVFHSFLVCQTEWEAIKANRFHIFLGNRSYILHGKKGVALKSSG